MPTIFGSFADIWKLKAVILSCGQTGPRVGIDDVAAISRKMAVMKSGARTGQRYADGAQGSGRLAAAARLRTVAK